jgi:hypothetical protein
MDPILAAPGAAMEVQERLSGAFCLVVHTFSLFIPANYGGDPAKKQSCKYM